jgi:putative copper export protein
MAAGALVFLTLAASRLQAAPWPLQEGEPGLLDAGALGRWLGYVALFLMTGAVAYRAIAARAFRQADVVSAAVRAPTTAHSLVLGLMGSLLYLVAAAGRLYAQVLDFLFPGDPLTAAEFATVLFDTTWGTRWLIQVACALVAAIGFAAARLARPWGTPVAFAGAIATAVSLPLTGHAMASAWPTAVTWSLQALHVLAGATWLGSLAVVTIVALGAARGRSEEIREAAVARLVGAFSPVALVGVITVVLMGILLSVSYVGSWAALWQTPYGRTLLVKIALFSGTGAVGAYNWRRVLPRLGTAGAAARLHRSARVELLIGALLLVTTAILVALAAPHV